MTVLLALAAAEPSYVTKVVIGAIAAVVLALIVLCLDSGPDDDDPFNKTGW